MVTAIILLKVEREFINDVAEAMTNMDEISEVYSVGGRVDLVAIVRVPENDQLAKLVTSKMIGLKGIKDTETMVAFRAYSQHDLERMFSIGMD